MYCAIVSYDNSYFTALFLFVCLFVLFCFVLFCCLYFAAVIESESLPEIILPDVADESSHASLASTVTTATDDKIDTMNDTNGPIEGWCSSTNEENPNSKLDNVVGEDSKTGSLAGIVGKRRHLNLNTHC